MGWERRDGVQDVTVPQVAKITTARPPRASRSSANHECNAQVARSSETCNRVVAPTVSRARRNDDD